MPNAPGWQERKDQEARPCRLKPAPKVEGETGNWVGGQRTAPPKMPTSYSPLPQCPGCWPADLTTARSVWVIPATQHHPRLGTAGKPAGEEVQGCARSLPPSLTVTTEGPRAEGCRRLRKLEKPGDRFPCQRLRRKLQPPETRVRRRTSRTVRGQVWGLQP